MNMPRRVFLNPCDYLLYSDHSIRMRRGQGPNVAYMCMDIDGPLDQERMRRSIARATAMSPVTLARLRFSILNGPPFWRLPRDPDVAARETLDKTYRFVDVSASGLTFDEPTATTGEGPSDFRSGPQICMTHYALDRDRSRLCIRWPHWLMDAAGTLAFLDLWVKCYTECGDDAPVASPNAVDVRQWKPLAGRRLRERWRAIRLRPNSGDRASLRIGAPRGNASGRVREHRVLHRCWHEAAMVRIRAAAKRDMPAGPARVTRYLATCVVQALDQLFEENGWPGDAYRITLPMRMDEDASDEAASSVRFGNYLTSPLIVIDRRIAGDRARLAEDLTQQLQAYQQARGAVAQWSWMSLAALLPFVAHRWIVSSPMFATRFSSGFSFYGESHPPLRSVDGMRISNLWGGGPTTIPPGMNPVFSRFDQSLNLALTYAWPAVSDEVAQRYVVFIEQMVTAESAIAG